MKVLKFNGNVCGNCIYFDQYPEQKREDNRLGACHANPPTPPVEDPYSTDEKKSKLGQWPLVLGTFWCGVFTKKDN